MTRQNSSHRLGPGKNQLSPSQARTRPDTRIHYDGGPHVDNTLPGNAYCSRCHAIWRDKHWHLDEQEYQQMSQDPAIASVICPGCEKVEREEFDGFVRLQSPLIPANEEAIIGLIRNTEEHVRSNNPLARIASLTLKGDTIEVLTITPFLAERIGKELRKAYHGQLEIKPAEAAQFVRVTWWRD